MIDIQNLSLLKITRVREWSICFKYDGQCYLIHGDSECGEGSWQDLYKKDFDEKGRYKLDFIKRCGYANDQVLYDYFGQVKNHTLVYSQINKSDFAYMLTKRGFATGIMQKEVDEENKKIEILKAELKEIRDNERAILNKIDELKKKGVQTWNKKYQLGNKSDSIVANTI